MAGFFKIIIGFAILSLALILIHRQYTLQSLNSIIYCNLNNIREVKHKVKHGFIKKEGIISTTKGKKLNNKNRTGNMI
jgi:hypothetical protein